MIKKKGSITVFLSLVLVLLFSFILTTVEAARITGATAYVSMLSQLSGDSFLASYYYPLFEQYHLFGVDAGYKTMYFSEEKTEQNFLEYMTYGLEELEGGLFSFETPKVYLQDYRTMLSKEGESFLLQVRQQSTLDSMATVMTEWFSLESLTDAGKTGQVYQKQEEALQKTNTVTQELLQLMEIVDGIAMTEQGLSLDREGRLQVQDTFLKQFISMSEKELVLAYQNEEIFKAVRNHLFSPKEIATQIKQLIIEASSIRKRISDYDETLAQYREELLLLQEELENILEEDEKVELLLWQEELEERKKSASNQRDVLIEQLDLVFMDASEQYDKLQEKMNDINVLTRQALGILDNEEKKQIMARISVTEYETFLNSVKEELSEDLYQVFEKELTTMKLYLGMEEQGYNVSIMKQSLKKNQGLLQELSLSGFSDKNLTKVNQEMEQIENRIGEYTMQGLWFTYGDVITVQETGYDVIEELQNILSGKILSLVGVEEDSISKRKLTGQELPSKASTQEQVPKDLLECMNSLVSFFRETTMQEIFANTTENASNILALEWYCKQYFGNYLEEKSDSKLLYEREYLIFGKQKEQENLFDTVLHLIAIRTLFTMMEIIKNPQKMTQLQTLAASIAGITGIPLLLSATKYTLLLLWSVEEAVIETTALLQGKKFSVLKGSGGMLTLSEIFLFSKELVAQKVSSIFTVKGGIGYNEYLMLFSITRGIQNKVYRAMDLIQETIRYRYRDSFRMRNVLTQVTFQTNVDLNKKYDTGLFSEQAYQLNCQQTYSYQ